MATTTADSVVNVDSRLAIVEAKLAIAELCSNYCYGFDNMDVDFFRSVWWDDSIWDFGETLGRHEGLDAITTFVRDNLWVLTAASHHCTTNLVVTDLTDDTARGRADVVSEGVFHDGTSQISFASYRDIYSRRGGEWRIQHRDVTIHWNRPPAALGS